MHNPIYNQGPIPLYDTIPAETLQDSEMNDASTFSAFKTSSTTFKAANAYYMDESSHSSSLSLTNSSSNINVHAPNVSFNHEDDAANDSVTIPSLECVEKFVADTDNGEEAYILMLPGGTVANSKS